MGIAVFFVLTFVVAGIIAYPLLPGRAAKQSVPAVSDGDIDRAVDNLRRGRSRGGHSCPACGRTYQAEDLFCVRCGHALPGDKVVSTGPACPSCGAEIHKGDQFCAKCGHRTGAGEAA